MTGIHHIEQSTPTHFTHPDPHRPRRQHRPGCGPKMGGVSIHPSIQPPLHTPTPIHPHPSIHTYIHHPTQRTTMTHPHPSIHTHTPTSFPSFFTWKTERHPPTHPRTINPPIGGRRQERPPRLGPPPVPRPLRRRLRPRRPGRESYIYIYVCVSVCVCVCMYTYISIKKSFM